MHFFSACPSGCLACDFATIDGSTGAQYCPEAFCEDGYVWEDDANGGHCVGNTL